MQIKAAVTPGIGEDFEIRDVDLVETKTNEVLIRVVASGVCHTDMSARDTGMTPLPAILGHEGSGIVEKVGEGVDAFEEGDHVVMSFTYCGECEQCLSGNPSTCIHLSDLNFGGRAYDGEHRHSHDGQNLSMFFGQSSFATYSVAHQQNIVKVPKDVDLDLLGPLGCGIQTGAGTVLNNLKPEFGSSIVVFGAGGVGLSAVMAAHINSCKNIIAVDLHENRLELAKELGATHVINGNDTKNLVNELKEVTDGGPHYAIDTTGVSSLILQGVQSLRPRGTMAVIGVGGSFEFNLMEDLMLEAKTIKGITEGDSVPKKFIPQLIEYYKEGKFPFDKLVKMYDFEDINQAFQDSEEGTTIKPVLKIS